MTAGDVLEWLAGSGLTYATWLATHKAWATILVGCVFLAYQAQCWATQPLGRHRKPANGPERITRPNPQPTISDRLEGLRVRLYVLPRRTRARLWYHWHKIRPVRQPKPATPPATYQPTVGELMAGLDGPSTDSVTTEV